MDEYTMYFLMVIMVGLNYIILNVLIPQSILSPRDN